MEKGNLAKWLKKEGEAVKTGDVIAEIETDKATMEYEAVDDGVLAKIVVPEGTADVPVNQFIAVLAQEGEDPKQAAAAAGDQNAREWLLDLKEVALAVHSEEAQTTQLLQAVHQLVDNHVQQATGPNGAQYVQQAYQQPMMPPQQPTYQQPMQQPVYQQQGGGGMLGRFLGGGFGSAIASVGLAIIAAIVLEWVRRGFGSLSEERLAILAATLMVLGIQVIFASFLLSILGLRRR